MSYPCSRETGRPTTGLQTHPNADDLYHGYSTRTIPDPQATLWGLSTTRDGPEQRKKFFGRVKITEGRGGVVRKVYRFSCVFSRRDNHHSQENDGVVLGRSSTREKVLVKSTVGETLRYHPF